MYASPEMRKRPYAKARRLTQKQGKTCWHGPRKGLAAERLALCPGEEGLAA
jgi:hypothetical protein